MSSPILFLDIDGVMNTRASIRGNLLAPRHEMEERISSKLPGAQRGDDAFGIARLCWLIFPSDPVHCLLEIITATDCGIVLISSWRRESSLDFGAIFEAQGIRGFSSRLLGVTPDLQDREGLCRGDEIEQWLSSTRYEGRLAIVDDNNVIGKMSRWCHVTDPESGLVPAVAENIMRMLTSGPVYKASDQEV